MSAIFKSSPGTLVAVRAGAASAALLSIEGLANAGRDVIISDFTAQDAVAAQVTPTIGGPHYIYSLGQRLTDMTVRLVTYPATCTEGETSGVKNAWAFYQQYRVSPDNVTPIKLTFAGMTIHAFVFGMTTRAASSDGIPVVVLELSMQGWVDPNNVETGVLSAIGQAASSLLETAGNILGTLFGPSTRATEPLAILAGNVRDARREGGLSA